MVSTRRLSYLIIKRINMFPSLGSDTSLSEKERCTSSIKCLFINQLHSNTIPFEDMGKKQGRCSRRIFHGAIERYPFLYLQLMVSGTITISYCPRGHIRASTVTYVIPLYDCCHRNGSLLNSLKSFLSAFTEN